MAKKPKPPPKPPEPPKPTPASKPLYHIEFAKSAEKSLAALPASTRRSISRKIDDLVINPRPPGVKKLEAQNDLYRIRMGDYRVIYSIEDKRLRVLVLGVGDRNEIYRSY